jgi:transcriptional regulator with XRE-family HTH domain
MATFGEKLRQLRKQRGWTQDKLGEEVGVHGRHIGKYESGKAMPNAEAIIRVAKTLTVSIDYLLVNDFQELQQTETSIQNQELLVKFKAVEGMSEKDKEIILSLIDAYIKKQQIENVLQQ